MEQFGETMFGQPANDIEKQWLLDRLKTLSVREAYQLSTVILTTGRLKEVSGKAGDELLATPTVPKGVWVCLPDHAAAEVDGRLGEIALALRELKVGTIQECELLEARCSLPGITIHPEEYPDLEDLIRDGNDLGFLLEEQGQGMPDFTGRFLAALEYENCHRLDAALDIAQNLHCYDFVRAENIETFGKQELERKGWSKDPILRGCIDTAEFGESLLEQMGYRLNTAETAYIRRNDREFQHLRTQPKQGWDMTMK